ncbi:hypothetical protein KDC22_27885 [Paenibacillus tritici]|uniref:hypothetical protein n=1 Tax=Paenibacillus tritici TaxID=1873425 RepID=UPI001BAC03C8|nr:hypothetical protein [Paenibacillus tritici]QUL54117.1 hypothetical protein KDC22_27885 [Paenibacillus tritici]
MNRLGKLLLALILIVVITGCSKFSSMPLPEMVATLETGETVPVEISTYSWGAKELYGGPWEAMEDKDPAIIPDGSTITIQFDSTPDSILIREHFSKYKFKDITESNQFHVPDSKGTYIYGVMATWKKGSAIYALKIQVE